MVNTTTTTSQYNAQYNGNQILIVCIILLVLTWLSVLLRCYVRLRIMKVFALDDWAIVIAQVVFTVSCAFLICGLSFGLGRHNSALSTENVIEALKYQALATLTYIINMAFIKLSIALFLLRIAVSRPYILTLQISIVIIMLWSLGISLYDIFQCTPISAQWDYTIEDKRCVSGNSIVAAAYSISAMNIVSDWLYALLPIPMVWNVKMSREAKGTVGFILSLGIFASIATLIRLKYLSDLADSSDGLYTGTEAMVWTLVEPGVAITAASLITIRPLLRSFKLRGFESSPHPTGEGTPGSGSRALNLRNDLLSGGWTGSVISTGGQGVGKHVRIASMGRLGQDSSKKGSVNTSEEEIGLGAREERGRGTGRSDAGSEEYIFESGMPLEIRRTVNVRVESGRFDEDGMERGDKYEAVD